MKLLSIGAVKGMKYLLMFTVIIAAISGGWFIIPTAVCLLLGFTMGELYLNGTKGWWVKKKLDHHRRK